MARERLALRVVANRVAAPPATHDCVDRAGVLDLSFRAIPATLGALWELASTRTGPVHVRDPVKIAARSRDEPPVTVKWIAARLGTSTARM